MDATELFSSIFNSDQTSCKKTSNQCKWVSGKRIMHLEQPWAIKAGVKKGIELNNLF